MTAVCCYIGLGSNLSGPAQQLHGAIKVLRDHRHLQVLDVSPFYRSVAVGPGEQPDYCNAVAKIRTDLSPQLLLDTLQAIEAAQGRDRTQAIRWGARTLDIDILTYGDTEFSEPRLTIPHPEMRNRNFVLRPLLDIADASTLPDLEGLAKCQASLGDAGLRRWSETAVNE